MNEIFDIQIRFTSVSKTCSVNETNFDFLIKKRMIGKISLSKTTKLNDLNNNIKSPLRYLFFRFLNKYSQLTFETKFNFSNFNHHLTYRILKLSKNISPIKIILSNLYFNHKNQQSFINKEKKLLMITYFAALYLQSSLLQFDSWLNFIGISTKVNLSGLINI
ncbi:hypothetical protein BpHYR1_011894 [Brachionus plicatilis]|uniref:Uncharacterized protein n=1 Tax=Brachionus plicatilis TaxID=10195 RepID=A0A3M7RC88_BRAPC|nr:hypothetical protein BpHYR1_011894 [Brachionus plicatilis]